MHASIALSGAASAPGSTYAWRVEDMAHKRDGHETNADAGKLDGRRARTRNISSDLGKHSGTNRIR